MGLDLRGRLNVNDNQTMFFDATFKLVGVVCASGFAADVGSNTFFVTR